MRIPPSEEYQNQTAKQLSAQVIRAIEVIVQRLHKADRILEGALLRDIAPETLYQAGQTVMMRLLFILYAEERGMLMLGTPYYDQLFSLSTLYQQLHTQTSCGGKSSLRTQYHAWPRILALFSALYSGFMLEQCSIPAVGGSLFDPALYPFLKGHFHSAKADDPSVPTVPIDDQTVLLLLNALKVLQFKDGPQILHYNSLEIEQMGQIYETLLDHTVSRVNETTLGFDFYRCAKGISPDISLCELEAEKLHGMENLQSYLSEHTGRKLSTHYWNKNYNVWNESLLHTVERLCTDHEDLIPTIMPYASMLRTNAWGEPVIYHKGSFRVTSGNKRSDTGTYYTPAKVAEIAVREALDPLIYDSSHGSKHLKSPDDILGLRICDPAMGTGAFLIEVCRYLANRLVESWQNTINERQMDELSVHNAVPNSAKERVMLARRLVAMNCLYGVDIDPMAIELAKWSMWLFTKSDHPIDSLNHAFKCGDSLHGIHDIRQLTQCTLSPSVQIETKPSPRLWTDGMTEKNPHLRTLCDAFIGTALREAHKPKKLSSALQKLMENADTILNDHAPHHDQILQEIIAQTKQDLSIDAIKQRVPFHWILEFPEIMNTGGFDAIVGNPPYGVDMPKRELEYHKSRFPEIEKKTDIYMIFYCHGLMLTKNTLSFVTPDKWLSKAFGLPFRKNMMKPYMTKIFHLGNTVFESAIVDTVISVFQKHGKHPLDIFVKNAEGKIQLVNSIDPSTLEAPYLIDQYFREQSDVVVQCEKHTHILSEYAKCEYSMLGPLAYQLQPLIYKEDEHKEAFLRVITTGLIDKYTSKWPTKSMKYLGQTYTHPVVLRSDIVQTFGNTFYKRVSSPKIIMKGLNLLDCCIDANGEYMSTVATLNIRSDNRDLLFVLAAILNSSLINKYIKSKYFTGNYCGGTLFTPDMINAIPTPELTDLSQWQDVICAIQDYLHAPALDKIQNINQLVSLHYGIT